MSASLPLAVRRLLDAGIDSLEKLDVVVQLRRAPGRVMSFTELASATGIERDELRVCLRQLASSGFLRNTGADTAALAERSAAEEAVVDEVVTIYDRDKTRLVIAITEIAMDRLRNLAGKAFADAFLIRKKSRDDDG